jgi:hypothetical protein
VGSSARQIGVTMRVSRSRLWDGIPGDDRVGERGRNGPFSMADSKVNTGAYCLSRDEMDEGSRWRKWERQAKRTAGAAG